MFKIQVMKHERALWFRHGDLHRVLGPGRHVKRSLLRPSRDAALVMSTLKTRFEHPLLDVLVENAELRDALLVVELGDTQRALVWKDQRLGWFLGPGRHAFWKTPYRLFVETFDIRAFRFEHPQLATIVQHPEASKWLEGVQVDARSEALLYRDGVLAERLAEGLHVFWRGISKVRWQSVDLREQVADVAGQEIITGDKVTLRVNLLVSYQVSDPVKAVAAVSDHAQALYREAQLVLRAAVGARTLDALLADKESVGNEVRQALAARVAEFGVTVRGVGLRDIILPGDMKALLNGVIVASKEAEANLIRRREETAAARSQANTAKLLAESPQLARLKELELLQDILKGANATFVFGEGDLAHQVRGLVAGNDPAQR